MRVNELEDLAEEIRKFPININEFELRGAGHLDILGVNQV